MGYTLGVDLGTTYSAAAMVVGGRAENVQLGSRAATIPSVVFLRDDGELLTGETAERRAATEPGRGGREFKRRFGDAAPILLGTTPFGAEALTASLLRTIVAQVSEERGEPPALVAMAHPASYGEYKLDLLRQAVRQAGMGHALLIAEPVAAATHYALQERIPDGAVIAIYDLGGGTFDAAVLRKEGDDFAILGEPEGLERLGGIDFDDAVLAHVTEFLGGEMLTVAGDPAMRGALVRLRDECRQAKESLSADTEATIPVLLPNLQTEVRLTRAQFEDAIRPRIRETIAALERAVRSAGLEMEQVDRILLVGGSSRIPLVGQMVRELTGRPVARDAHPKHTIALGAALFAARHEAATVPAISAPPELAKTELPAIVAAPTGPAEAVADGQRKKGLSETEAANEPASRAPAPASTLSSIPAAESSRGDSRSTGRRLPGQPRWLLAGLAVVAVGAAVVAALALSGGGEGRARAEITDARLEGGVYRVWFRTEGLTLSEMGAHVVFYWNTLAPETGFQWAGGSPISLTGQPPAEASQICIAVVPADGEISASSGNCWTVS